MIGKQLPYLAYIPLYPRECPTTLKDTEYLVNRVLNGQYSM